VHTTTHIQSLSTVQTVRSVICNIQMTVAIYARLLRMVHIPCYVCVVHDIYLMAVNSFTKIWKHDTVCVLYNWIVDSSKYLWRYMLSGSRFSGQVFLLAFTPITGNIICTHTCTSPELEIWSGVGATLFSERKIYTIISTR